jgi:hypothetical protein
MSFEKIGLVENIDSEFYPSIEDENETHTIDRLFGNIK